MSPLLHNFLKAPVFSNTGSVARDHLASERTFLAWVRTGLGFMALGVAVDRFNQLDVSSLVTTLQTSTTLTQISAPDDTSKAKIMAPTQKNPLRRANKDQILVAALMGTSIGSITYGFTRYMSNFRLLQQGKFKAACAGPAVFSFVVSGIVAASFGGMYEFQRSVHV